MPKYFSSPSTRYKDVDIDWMGERYASAPKDITPVTSSVPRVSRETTPDFTYSTEQLPFPPQTGSLWSSEAPQTGALFSSELPPDPRRSKSEPVHDVATTQSLIAALHATMTPSEVVARRPVVIPGKGRSRQSGMTRPVRSSSRLRLIIVTIVLLVAILTALLSLSPLGSGQNGFHLFGSVFDWAQSNPQNWSIVAHLTDPNAGQNTTPADNQGAAVPQPVALPQSQYVAIARQDAVTAGINPDYFVRQIFVESGFNPGAMSGAGAVGIAQFIPSTAANLGVNPYDPVSALKGAAQLMASYSNQYGGDYAKALAAYNAGGGTVDYAVRIGGANWMTYLPFETRSYIAKIMGI